MVELFILFSKREGGGGGGERERGGEREIRRKVKMRVSSPNDDVYLSASAAGSIPSFLPSLRR